MIIKKAAVQAQYSEDKMGKVSLAAGDFLYAGLNCFEPGQEHKAHAHADQDKMYVVLEGTGTASVGDDVQRVEAGDVILARAGVMHSMKNDSDARLAVMVIFGPPPKRG